MGPDLSAVTAREKWKEPQGPDVEDTAETMSVASLLYVGRKLEGEEGRSVVKIFFKMTLYSWVFGEEEEETHTERKLCLLLLFEELGTVASCLLIQSLTPGSHHLRDGGLQQVQHSKGLCRVH